MKGDKNILSLLKNGDKQVFDIIFKMYAARLYFFSLDFFNSKAEAEEVVQETFVQLWKNRSKIDGAHSRMLL